MRRLSLGGGVAHALTDCAPAPAEWGYAFPEADAPSRPDLRARWFPDGRFHTRFGVFLLQIGVANVLSIIEIKLCLRAMAAAFFRSTTRSVGLVGDSRYSSLVFGRIALSCWS